MQAITALGYATMLLVDLVCRSGSMSTITASDGTEIC